MHIETRKEKLNEKGYDTKMLETILVEAKEMPLLYSR